MLDYSADYAKQLPTAVPTSFSPDLVSTSVRSVSGRGGRGPGRRVAGGLAADSEGMEMGSVVMPGETDFLKAEFYLTQVNELVGVGGPSVLPHPGE